MHQFTDEVKGIFARCNAILTDIHVVYASGKHGPSYVNKDAIYPHVFDTAKLCAYLACLVNRQDIEVVIGPVVGGSIMAQWIAHYLSNRYGKEVLAAFADKDGDGFVIKRGYDKLIKGKRALVVDDILTTGGSIAKVITVVKTLTDEEVEAACMCNRGAVTSEQIGVSKLTNLLVVDMQSFDQPDCQKCKDHDPLRTDVGKGKDWLETEVGQQWLRDGGSVVQI